MNRFNLFLLALGLLPFAACTTSPFNIDGYSRIEALSYYEWVMQAQMLSLQEEQARFAALAESERSPQSLVQYAILISARNDGGAQSDVEAIALLESVETAALPAEYKTFSILWQQVLDARQQLRTKQGLLQSLEQERITLQSQIDALTSIEQQLNNREELQGM